MPGDTGEDYDGDMLATDMKDVNLKSAPSDLTLEITRETLGELAMSDPDLATCSSGVGSSAASVSSRPSSSSGLMTPDLTLPVPEEYTTDAGQYKLCTLL